MATTPTQLLIIYNADSSIRGKITYAYRKLSSSSNQDPACAACDITHGGLSLKEVPGWTEAKRDIESQGVKVVQWHRDEVEDDVKNWVTAEGVRYPTVLVRNGERGAEGVRVVADSADLASCAGDATKLVGMLKEKGVLKGDGSNL